MNVTIERCRAAAATADLATLTDSQSLRIAESNGFHIQYAPFDYVNERARVVLVGLTPGGQQMRNAVLAYQQCIRRGDSVVEALRLAKCAASFSGPMRANLLACLDKIGIPALLKIGSASELFAERADLVHYTSAVRYPAFFQGKNYSGTPPILSVPLLRRSMESWMGEEMRLLPNAIYIPLGPAVAASLISLAESVGVSRKQIFSGMPHPSGANSERIQYFLGNKHRDRLSAKTNAEKIDAQRIQLLSQVSALMVGG
jgi:hypothetical protein